MLIFDDKNRTIILDNVHTPVLSEYFWVLDLEIMDFTITPLFSIEETVSKSMRINIRGFEFFIPTSWHILVVDEETSQLDLISVNQLAGKDFNAFIYGYDKWKFELAPIRVMDFSLRHVHVGPFLNKQQMLCHPINQTDWINISPTDSFNRYLKNKVAGDLI